MYFGSEALCPFLGGSVGQPGTLLLWCGIIISMTPFP